VNLNAIAKFVAAHGIDLAEARVVGDISEEIVTALNHLRTRYTYVFTTGGIGPTHDDITADCVAEAFGVALHEDQEILDEMAARLPLNAARRRMARIPEGGSKIKNIVGGPPGFQIGNVFVLAGVPLIMRGMLEDIGWRLQGGKVVVARTLKVEGSGEGVIAEPLEAVARAHTALTLGSYPFFGDGGYGANLVIRGRDADEVAAALEELKAALTVVGVAKMTEVET